MRAHVAFPGVEQICARLPRAVHVDEGVQLEALPFGEASAGPWLLALAPGGWVQIGWTPLVVVGEPGTRVEPPARGDRGELTVRWPGG